MTNNPHSRAGILGLNPARADGSAGVLKEACELREFLQAGGGR